MLLLANMIAATIRCGEDSSRYSCPDKNTCCPTDSGGYACVPVEAGESDAVCCGLSGLACPAQYRCAPHGDRHHACVSPAGPLNCSLCNSSWPYPQGMAGWQLPYHACPAFEGAPPIFRLKLADGMHFEYYSNMGAIGGKGGDSNVSTSVVAKDIEIVMIVQHGANRNGLSLLLDVVNNFTHSMFVYSSTIVSYVAVLEHVKKFCRYDLRYKKINVNNRFLPY